jgi:D-alanyl-D-alanine carboxypeptidase
MSVLQIPEGTRRKPLELDAKAVISVFVDHQGPERILFEKDSNRPLPIASLTKLMTASIFLEHYNIEREEVLELILSLLIESNNESANDLAALVGEDSFLELMNLEAEAIGMENTYFVNPNGLDSKEPGESSNYSTADDLVKLSRYITLEQPLLWEISTIQEFEGMENTNELLGEVPGIIGGKTGETALAGKCLILVVRAPKNKGFIVNIILNSENRFQEMKKLINWTEDAYNW